MKRLLALLLCGSVLCGVAIWTSLSARAQDEEVKDRTNLSLDQQRVQIRYKELQDTLLRLAEITQATDPARAELLRKAFAQGSEKQIEEKLAALVKLIGNDQLGKAVDEQAIVKTELNKLLELLMSEQGPKRLAEERKRFEKYLEAVKKLIRDEQEIEERIRAGGNQGQLAGKQDRVANDTGKLGNEIAKNEGLGKTGDGKSSDSKSGDSKSGDSKSGSGKSGDVKSGDAKAKGGEGKSGDAKSKSGDGKSSKSGDSKPGEGKGKGGEGDGKSRDSKSKSGDGGEGKGKGSKSKSGGGGQGDPRKEPEEGGDSESDDSEQKPQDRLESTKKRIYNAEKRMREAKQKLEKAEREGAAEDARVALKELKAVEKELEELLRQLREEELERLLAFLEARFKKMLEMEVAVYEGTLRLDRTPQNQRGAAFITQTARLGRDQSLIEIEAEKALNLLREDGTSVAMTESVMEMIGDMKQVQVFLSQGKTAEIPTRQVEEDIIAALEEMIEALKRAQRDNQAKSQPGQGGTPPDPSLIDLLAEVKMLKSLQLRVNRRTEMYRRQLKNPDDDQGVADRADLEKGLAELREREERIFRATRDLVTGRNK